MTLLAFISLLLPASIQAVLLVLLVSRKCYLRTSFPFFVAYTLYSILAAIGRLVLLKRPTGYPMFYWSTEVIYGVLALLSLNEVFNRVFRLDYEEHPQLRLVFPCTVLAISIGLFAWWRFVYRTRSGGHLGLLPSAFVGFHQGVHSIEGILLALFMLFWFLFDPGWNRYDYGILLGFGLSGLITMTADMVRFNTGHSYQIWSTYAPGIAYIVVTFIWLYIFWPAPEPKPVVRFQIMIEQARRNNEIVKAIHRWLQTRH